MPLTNYLTLGRSGLRVSPFCLGTMTFGEDWGWGSPVADSEAILSRYLERGGNFLDTANGYTKGHSEVIIGDYFARAGRRDRVVIATKFGTNLYIGDPNGGGASRKTIIESCEQSLRRLKTDYIDLYWMHFWDPHTPIDETMRALDDLVRAGKVRYLGVSDTPAWKVTQGHIAGAVPRRGAVRGPADRIFAGRAHRGGRAGADGARAGPRHHAMVAAAWRRALRQVHARQRGARPNPTAATASSRSSPSAISRSSMN